MKRTYSQQSDPQQELRKVRIFYSLGRHTHLLSQKMPSVDFSYVT